MGRDPQKQPENDESAAEQPEQADMKPLAEETIEGTALGVADTGDKPVDLDEAEADRIVNSIW